MAAGDRNPTFIPRKSYFQISPNIIKGDLIKQGLDAAQAEAISRVFSRLFNKFGADERLNYDVIEANLGGGGGARPATLVIASDDTSDIGKESADYVCDGTADDVEISVAIEELIARTGANNQIGRLLFLEGDFNMSATVTPSTHAYFEMIGMGKRVTKFFGSDARATFDFNTIMPQRISGFTFEEGGPAISWMTVDEGIVIDNCHFEDCEKAILGEFESGFSYLDYYVKLLYNTFYDCGDATNDVIDLRQRTFELHVVGNSFDSSDLNCSELVVTSDHAVQVGQNAIISNNHFRRPVEITDYDYGSLTGNIFETDLTMTNCNDWAIAGNTLLGTYTETGCAGFSKAGNVGIV